MPTFTKRHGRYVIRFKKSNRHPKEKSESLPSNIAKREIKRIEGDMNSAYFSGKWDPWLRSWKQYRNGEEVGIYTLGDAIDDYIAYCKTNNRWNSRSTIRMNTALLRWLRELLGDNRMVSEIGNDDVVAFFQSKDIAPLSEKIYLQKIKAFHNWLRRNGYNSNDIEYRPPKSVSNDILHFSEKELHALIDHVHASGRETAQVYEDIWRTMFYQCLRGGEVFCDIGNTKKGITPQHIHGNRLTVHGKGNKVRVIPLVAPVRDRLLELKYEAQKNNQPTIFPFCSHKGFLKYTKQMIKKCLPEHRHVLNLHSLRRGGGIYWTQKGIPLAALKELLGHSSISTTEKHYGRFQPGGMEKIFGG